MDLPQLSEEQPAHRAAASPPTPGPGRADRGLAQRRRGRLRARSPPSAAGRGSARWSPTSTPARPRASTSATRWSSTCSRGTLASVTDLALFGGANALAVESAPGVWEVLQAAHGRAARARAATGSPGCCAASAAPRGDGRSGARRRAGGRARRRARGAADRRGRARPAVRPGASGRRCGRRATRATSRRASRPRASGLRPFSVVHVEQPWRTAREPGDLTIRWTRRSRALAADSWDAAEAPLAEESEAYEVEILDGADGASGRSSSHDAAVTYTAAQQTADWGALLGPGDTLDLRIFQLSALVGRGTPAVRHAAILKEPDVRPARTCCCPIPRRAGAEARHRQRGAAAARRPRAARRARPPPDRAAGEPGRRRPLHRRVRRHRRLGRLGPQRRLLGRRRLDAARAAAGLAGLGRRRGDLRRLGRQRLGRRRRCRPSSPTRSSARA